MALFEQTQPDVDRRFRPDVSRTWHAKRASLAVFVSWLSSCRALDYRFVYVLDPSAIKALYTRVTSGKSYKGYRLWCSYRHVLLLSRLPSAVSYHQLVSTSPSRWRKMYSESCDVTPPAVFRWSRFHGSPSRKISHGCSLHSLRIWFPSTSSRSPYLGYILAQVGVV